MVNKDELLKLAKEKYPIGTKYHLPKDPDWDQRKVFTIIDDEFIWGPNDNIYGKNWRTGEDHSACVYFRGIWGKIVSSPEIVVNNFEIW